MKGPMEQSEIDKLIATLASIPDFDADLADEVEHPKSSSPRTAPGFFKNNTGIFEIIDKAELDNLYAYMLDFPDGIANARTEHGQTPLHYAVRDASPTAIRLEIIKIILAQGGDILARDSEGRTPIHIAANAPFAFESLELLLAHGVGKFGKGNNNNFNGYADLSHVLKIPDNKGLTALHYAIIGGRLESIEALLLHNAPLDCREPSINATPLLWCFKYTRMSLDSLETVFMLVVRLSNLVGIEGIIAIDFDAVDASGDTLLHHACEQHGAHKIVQALIRYGATISRKPAKEGGRPYVIKKDDAERAKIIRGYLQDPASAKKGDMLLLPYEPKLIHLYLNPNIVEADKSVLSDPSTNRNAPLINSQLNNPQAPLAVGRLRTLPSVPLELDRLYDSLKRMLSELPDISKRFLEALRYLEANDKDLFRQVRCLSYLRSYGCVYKLPESSAFINNILTIHRIKTDMDIKYSFLTMGQYRKLNEDLNKLISKCKYQIDVLTDTVEIDSFTNQKILRSFDKMSVSEVKKLFPDNDYDVIKSIYKDKATLEIFVAGLRRKVRDYLAVKEKNDSVIVMFTSIQQFIMIVEYVQQIFIVTSQAQSNPQVLQRLKSTVDKIYHEQMDASLEAGVSTVNELSK